MPDTFIFRANELTSPFPMRVDQVRDNDLFRQLLADDEIEVDAFQPSGLYEYHGTVRVRGRSIVLAFGHKGGRKGTLSSLKSVTAADPEDLKLIEQVVILNARSIPGVRAHIRPVETQPHQLRIRVTSGRKSTKSSGTSEYKSGLGYLGELAFTDYWREHAPQIAYEWLNEEKESGRPFDILLDGRMAVDVKSTTIERTRVDLSPREAQFRHQHLAHHAVALISFENRRPKRIDLYLSAPLKKVTLEEVKDVLRGLPPLTVKQVAETPEGSAEPQDLLSIQSRQETRAYLEMGEYTTDGARLLLANNGSYTLLENRHDSPELGTFYLLGRRLILMDEEGRKSSEFVVGHRDGRVQLQQGGRTLIQSQESHNLQRIVP